MPEFGKVWIHHLMRNVPVARRSIPITNFCFDGLFVAVTGQRGLTRQKLKKDLKNDGNGIEAAA